MNQHDELTIDIDLDPAFDAGPASPEDSGIIDLRALLEEQRAAEAAGASRPLVTGAPPLVAERRTEKRPSAPLLVWLASVAVFALSAIVYAAATPRSASSAEALRAPAKHELSSGDHTPMPKPAQPVMVASVPEPETELESHAPTVAPTPTPRVRARRPAGPPEPSRPTPPAHSWDSGSVDGETPLDGSIDDLLDRALGSSASDPLRETLPETPTRRQVSVTLRALEGEVRECAESGIARVRLVVDGATGRVSSASVGGEHSGTAAASCIAQKVRSAHFPRFERERFVIDYPYVL